MPTDEPTLDPESLLEQVGWVHELARRLVVDPGLREDVAQEALLVALERRPAVLSPRAWLSRLVRNIAWEMNRSEGRRRALARSAGEPRRLESPDQLAELAELQARLALSVTRLAEPYRSTVLQRYFRGRSAEEIARREGVPAATVRTRLKRALDQLREEFREEQRERRGAWLALLVPAPPLEGALLPTTASLLTTGGLAVKSISVLLGLVVLSLAVFFVARSDDEVTATPEEVEAAGPPPVELEPPVETPAETALEPPAGPREPLATRAEVEGTTLALEGVVIDRETREPVTAFRAIVRRRSGTTAAGSYSDVANERVTDPGGRFRFAMAESGTYRLQVFHPAYLPADQGDVIVDEASESTSLLVELDPGLSVSGWALDDETGRPVAGVLVLSTRGSNVELLRRGKPELYAHTVTDARGRFHLAGLDETCGAIAALHEGYAEAWASVTPGQPELVELRLKRGPHLFGTAYDDAGRPKGGVWITLHGDELPLGRPLVTGDDGTYRTPPVRPGTVELRATPPSGETDDSFGFSAEWQVARVKEGADVRVDFGARRDWARWIGTLFGSDGKALSGASVSIFYSPTDPLEFENLLSNARDCTTDERGRFDFRKVPLGRYRLLVWSGGKSILGRDVTIVLETPGVHEEDIHLDASQADGHCRIRGSVVDAATGRPIETEGRLSVMASQTSPGFRSWRADARADGTFELDGLPEGRTQVYAVAQGWSPTPEVLTLREDHSVEDLRLVLTRSGTLHLVLEGFVDLAPRAFRYAVFRPGEQMMPPQEGRIPEPGLGELTRPLAPGAWQVQVQVEGLGSAQRAFEVVAGEVTPVELRPEDLVLEPPEVTVIGDLRREDGTPVPQAYLYFFGGQIPGIDPANRGLGGRTDDEGMFETAGFVPGRWSVRGTIDGSSVIFPDLALPDDASDPFPLHLVVPGGRLVGVLFDRRTGKPLGEDSPRRWLFLAPSTGGPNVSEVQGGQTGSAFALEGIPEGDYRLTVKANGYAQYTSEQPIHHPGTGVVDLGRIELEPCGTLELEVVDEAGASVAEYELYVNDTLYPRWQRLPLEGGWIGLSPLPLGKVTVEVRAEGFWPVVKELDFAAGAPTRERFVMPAK